MKSNLPIDEIKKWVLRIRHQNKAESGPTGQIIERFHPLILCAIIYFVFKHAFKINEDELLFPIILKYLLWNFFSKCLMEGSNLFIIHRQTLKNFKVTLQSLILAHLTIKIEILVTNTFILGVFIFFRLPGAAVQGSFLLCLIIVMIYFLCWGMLNIFSILRVFSPSISKWLEMSMVVLFWLSPVFYNLSFMPSDFIVWSYLNPLSWLLSSIDALFTETHLSSHLINLSCFTLFAVLVFFKSCHYFKKHEKEVVHVL